MAVLTAIVHFIFESSRNSIDVLLVDFGVQNRLKASIQVALVAEPHQFEASPWQAFWEEAVESKRVGHYMCLSFEKTHKW